MSIKSEEKKLLYRKKVRDLYYKTVKPIGLLLCYIEDIYIKKQLKPKKFNKKKIRRLMNKELAELIFHYNTIELLDIKGSCENNYDECGLYTPRDIMTNSKNKYLKKYGYTQDDNYDWMPILLEELKVDYNIECKKFKDVFDKPWTSSYKKFKDKDVYIISKK